MKCSFGEVVKCPPFSLPSPQPPLCTCTQTHHGSHLYVYWMWATFSYNIIIFSSILKYERLFEFMYFKVVFKIHLKYILNIRAVIGFSSVRFCSVTQSCLTLCDPTNCSMPGLPVHHQLQEPTQTHVHWVGDAIQPPHPLLSSSPPALNLS